MPHMVTRAYIGQGVKDTFTELPPAGHRVLDTCDVEQGRVEVARRIGPHRVTVLTEAGRLRVVQNYAFLGNVGVGGLVYDQPVEIEMDGAPETSYRVEIPLRGQLSVQCGGQELNASPERGFIVNPNDSLRARWDPGTAVLTVHLDNATLRQRVEACTGRAAGRGPRFDRGLDLTKGVGRTWSTQVWALVRDIEHGDGWTRDPLMTRQWTHLLMDGLLHGQPGTHSGLLRASESLSSAAPQALRKLIEQIRTHPECSWATTDIARVANLSARAIQKAFAHHYDTTPRAYVREIRLARVRADLINADPSIATVGEIARRWRFNELGRFAAHYRSHYGESPSETLRRP